MIKPKRHSPSSIASAEQCPAKYKYKFIDRLPDTPGPAAARGQEIHSSAERYLKRLVDRPSPTLRLFKSDLRDLRKLNPMVEQYWSIDRRWRPNPPRENRYFVGKIDAGYVVDDELTIIDHKTGKVYDFTDQGKFYAALGLVTYPEVKLARVEFWMIDQGLVVGRATYPRRALPGIRSEINHRIKRIEQEKRYAPKPGSYCRWCSYSKSKGGPCRY